MKGVNSDKKLSCKFTLVGLRTLSKWSRKPFKFQLGELQLKLYEAMNMIKAEVDLAEYEESNLERRRAEEERCQQN